MSADAARRYVRGEIAPAPARPEPVARAVDPDALAARRHSFDPADREMLKWIDAIDEEGAV